MTLTIILLVVGFILLIKGADFLVDGSSSIAKRLRISDLVIGLTVVAFGTSAPELIVNILASLNGTVDIAIGNILGSNIANVFLILGICAIIYPLKVKLSTAWKEIPFSFLAALVLGFMVNDIFLDGAAQSVIGRVDGLILLSLFAIFLYYIVGIARAVHHEGAGEEIKRLGLGRSIIYVVIGLVGLVIGGKWVVDGAVAIAELAGLSETLIGLTIVAVGTSLPELATSAVAAYKKKADIAVGNIVGSNIFNIFWILGISALISPLPFSTANMFDIAVVIASSMFLFIFLFVGKRHLLERYQGALFVLIYAAYITAIVIRG